MFYNGIEGYSIKIAKKNYKTNLLQNIMVYDHSKNKDNKKVTIADSGYMRMTADEQNLIFTLYNGYTFEEIEETKKNRRLKDKTYPHRRQKFEKQVVIFELTGLDFSRTDEDLFKNNYQMMNIKQLEYTEDSLLKQHYKQIKDFSNNLLINNYFKKEKMMFGEFEKIDKLNRRIKNKKAIIKELPEKNLFDSTINSNSNMDSIKMLFSVDSVFNTLNSNNKDHIMQYALTYVRAAQNNITNSKKQFNYKAERIRRHQIEWHRKFALPFACLVFFFIGAPFGAIIRKGGFGTPVVISILFFILYYIISISGEKFAREGVMPPYIGMWLSSFILMPLGIFLTYKATTDSVILNADTYLLFFKKLFKRFSKKSN